MSVESERRENGKINPSLKTRETGPDILFLNVKRPSSCSGILLSSTGLGNGCYKFQSEMHELSALQGKYRSYWKYRIATSDVDQLVECLHGRHEALGSILSEI